MNKQNRHYLNRFKAKKPIRAGSEDALPRPITRALVKRDWSYERGVWYPPEHKPLPKWPNGTERERGARNV